MDSCLSFALRKENVQRKVFTASCCFLFTPAASPAIDEDCSDAIITLEAVDVYMH